MDVFQKEEDTNQQTVKKDLIQEQEVKALKEGVTNAQPEEDVRNYKVIMHITYTHVPLCIVIIL